MRPFDFPLQALLMDREQQEARAKRALAERARQRALLEGLAQRRREIMAPGATSPCGAPLDARTLRLQAEAALAAMRDAATLARARDTANSEFEGARGRLAECARQRRIVERLREGRRAAWESQRRRAEQSRLDDLHACRTEETLTCGEHS